MAWTLVLPAVLALLTGIVAARVHHRLRPSLATAGLAALAVTAVIGVVGALAMVALVFLGEIPWLADRLAWCLSISGDHNVPTVAGGIALVGLGAMAAAGTLRMRRLRATAAVGDEGPVVILPTPHPTAFAVPGRPGHVVVSQGMLRGLDPDERRVLFAHERAHLRREHHRYVWISEVAAAALPVLRPLRRAVRLSTERWADEDAAAEVGDRRLVARAICRAALVQHDTATSRGLSMAGPDVSRRVEALLGRPDRGGLTFGLLTGVTMLGVALAASTVQLHHLAVLAAHLCGGA